MNSNLKCAGMKKNEVDRVLEEIAVLLENNNQENLKLSKEVETLSIQLTSLKQYEDTIKGAAIDARRNADLTIANAKTEGQQLIAKARAEGDTILTSRAKEVANIEAQIAKLTHARESYLVKVRDMISSHLSILDEIMEVEPPPQKIQEQLGTGKIQQQPKKQKAVEKKPIAKSPDDIDVTDSSEVKLRKRETVATEPSKQPSVKIEDAQSAGRVIEVPTPHLKPTDQEIAKNLEKIQEDESHSKSSDSDDDTMPPNVPEKPPIDDLSANLDELVDVFEKTMDEASGENQ